MGNFEPHYWQGKSSKIALIFSVPGQEEDNAKRPIVGATGNNFELVLTELKKKRELFADYGCRYCFRITNSFSTPMWKSKDGRTEPTDEEICDPDNLDRLLTEIEDVEKAIICFGEKAFTAIKNLKKLDSQRQRTALQKMQNIIVVKTAHTSWRYVKKMDKEKKPQSICNEIIKQLKKPQYTIKDLLE